MLLPLFGGFAFGLEESALGQVQSVRRIQDLQTLYESWVGSMDPRIRLSLVPVPELVAAPSASNSAVSASGNPAARVHRELAAYFPEGNRISVSLHGQPSVSALRRVVLHELGHAFVLKNVSPKALCSWAKTSSPWRSESLDCDSLQGYYDEVLKRPHPLALAPASFLESSVDIPSRYALESIHEYFAESFVTWLENGTAATRTAVFLSGQARKELIAVADSTESR